MSGLPIVLDTGALHCVLVGCGGAGGRKLTSLLESGASVTVIDPHGIDSLPDLHVVHTAGDRSTILRRRWRIGDSDGARLVVIATDDPAVNAAAADEARRAGSIVLRCDRPADGDLRLPAVHRRGRVTVAIDTDGASPTLSAYLRDEIALATHGWDELADWAAANRPITIDDLARHHDAIRQRTTPREHTT